MVDGGGIAWRRMREEKTRPVIRSATTLLWITVQLSNPSIYHPIVSLPKSCLNGKVSWYYFFIDLLRSLSQQTIVCWGYYDTVHMIDNQDFHFLISFIVHLSTILCCQWINNTVERVRSWKDNFETMGLTHGYYIECEKCRMKLVLNIWLSVPNFPYKIG